jgi:uncharacterized phage protein (TIGR01671 family)
MQDRFKFRVYDDVYNDGKMVYFGGLVNVGTTLPLMQCTGLKDKNGKLIYEGDILKLAEFGKPVEVKHRALGFVLRREPSNTVGYDNDKYIPEDCEVIGNIYENPELLEVSNDH